MILAAASGRERSRVLDNGCGVGAYLEHLAGNAATAVGIEYDFDRARQAARRAPAGVAAGENLPFARSAFDLILSHEVLEHVADDRKAVEEIARVLRPGGRAVIFAPNRGYPFETHGVFWRGAYRFGNIPLVNYLPRRARDRLAPHVRAYASRDLERLVAGLPLRVVSRTIIYGGYDNLVARWGLLGRAVRAALQAAERTPLRAFGLSHVWVVEKTP